MHKLAYRIYRQEQPVLSTLLNQTVYQYVRPKTVRYKAG